LAIFGAESPESVISELLAPFSGEISAKMGQISPQTAENGPKSPQNAPKSPQNGEIRPKSAEMTEKTVENARKWAEIGLKIDNCRRFIARFWENSAHSAVIACVSGDEGWRIPEFMLCEGAERALKIAVLGVLEPEIADLEGARCVKIAVLGYLKWFFVFLTLF
jgi:hypothetical protein